MEAVSVRDVAVGFGDVNIFENLSMEIEKGEFIVLLGPSGCGKSTLLNAIAGLLDVKAGQVWIDGRNVTWDEPKDRGIGMVFQSYSLYPRMSVEMNLSFGLRIAKVPKDEIERRVAKASKLLQLDPLLQRKPAELSGGQRQRVAIGRALVRNVDVFLFDEPLSNLDAKLRNELRVEIKKLHQEIGNTMIYVTHDQVEALTLADRIAVMKGGVIQQFASPHDIYHRPANLFVAGFIGSPAMNTIEGSLGQREGAWRLRSAGPVGRRLALSLRERAKGGASDARRPSRTYRRRRRAARTPRGDRQGDDRRTDGRRGGAVDVACRQAGDDQGRRRLDVEGRRRPSVSLRHGAGVAVRRGNRPDAFDAVS